MKGGGKREKKEREERQRETDRQRQRHRDRDRARQKRQKERQTEKRRGVLLLFNDTVSGNTTLLIHPSLFRRPQSSG